MATISTDQLSPFLSYLQKRMDFIAQVATSPPSWCLLTDFDSLIKGFTNQKALTKNIIRSHQGTESGPNFEPLIEKNYGANEKKAPLLDLPHGEIGGQAFYTILENIVRNTAKYGDPAQLSKIKARTGDGKLKFTIAVDEYGGDGKEGWIQNYYRIRIMDHLKNKNRDGSPNQAVVDTLNTYLSEELTDPITGVVKAKNWGMKEIKICAAYLRMVKQDEIDMKFEQWANDQNPVEPPMIEVSLERLDPKSKEPAAHLTYTLYLLRPKQALVVSDEPPPRSKDPNENLEKGLRDAGIDFQPLKKFLHDINHGTRPRHTFIVLPKPQNEPEWGWLKRNLNFLPPRVLIRDGTTAQIPPDMPELARVVAFTSSPLSAHPARMIETLWTQWVNRWWGNYRILVRDRRHGDTIAEEGKDETWDEPAKLPAAEWLVFDHKDNQDATTLFESAAYHQGFRHGSLTAQLLEKKSKGLIRDTSLRTDGQLENYSRLRIKEAAGLSVAVIDERVWLEKDGQALEGVSHYAFPISRVKAWAKRRVYLQNTNKALDAFASFVDNLYPSKIHVFDFLIIHQGIIDTVRAKEPKYFEDAWTKLKDRARWVVIDSGRGQPEQAGNDDLRWVEYSNLAECLVQYAGDKFRLAELLWTLRASGKNGGPT